MEQEFKFCIHEYTYIRSENIVKHHFYKTNLAKNMIRSKAKNKLNHTKVFLVLNGCENEEEAYVLEGRNVMRVFSRDAIRAVEVIACLPFYQYSRQLLIEQLTERLYIGFINEPDEKERPF